MRAYVFLFTVLPGSSAGLHARERAPEVSSPNKAVTVRFVLKDGRVPMYAIQRYGQTLLADSRLGFVLKDQDGKDAEGTTNLLPVDSTTQPFRRRYGTETDTGQGAGTAIRFAEVK